MAISMNSLFFRLGEIAGVAKTGIDGDNTLALEDIIDLILDLM